MTTRKVRFVFTHGWSPTDFPNALRFITKPFRDRLKSGTELEISYLNGLLLEQEKKQEQKPDVLFISHFPNTNHSNELTELLEQYRNDPEVIKIFFSGEPYTVNSTWLSAIHILVDCKKDIAEWSNAEHATLRFYFPLWRYAFTEMKSYSLPMLLHQHHNKKEAKGKNNKKKFCAFMYSAPVYHRNQFFHLLSTRYKPADALGLQPFGVPKVDKYVEEEGLNKLDSCVTQFREYKFVISFENQQKPGYITEKLATALAAEALPIYLGAPDIGKYFNTKRFVDVGSYDSFQDCIDHVAKIDEDDNLYQQFLSEPVFTEEQKASLQLSGDDFANPIVKELFILLEKRQKNKSNEKE